MPLTVKHLNADASFLLSFSPSPENCLHDPLNPTSTSAPSQPLTVLLDPWLVGGSKIYHSKFSYSTHRQPLCIDSLAELPEPDLVIISQSKTDHCNEATLKTLPPTGTKTLFLCEPGAAKIIKSWHYFDVWKIISMTPYVAPIRRLSSGGTRVYVKNKSLQRILIPALAPGGLHGQIAVAFVPQKMDLTQLHNAMCITYRPPTASIKKAETISLSRLATGLMTPPQSPTASHAVPAVPSIPAAFSTAVTPTTSPIHTPPDIHIASLSPHTSTVTPASSPTSTQRSQLSGRPSNASSASLATTCAGRGENQPETLSVIFSPHGVSPRSLECYIKHQLTPYTARGEPPESVKPLTLLLHCFDEVANPWFMGGAICTGFPTGKEIVAMTKARCWVSAHDEDKKTTGVATLLTKFTHYKREAIEKELHVNKGPKTGGPTPSSVNKMSLGSTTSSIVINKGAREMEREKETEVLVLASGEEITLT